MKKADIIADLRQALDVDTAYASDLKMTLTDDEVWGIFMRAVPEIPQYRQCLGLTIYEQQFLPYYDPDTAELTVDPFLFSGSGVVVSDSLYLAAPPGSGWLQTAPIYEWVNADEANRIKEYDPSYRRNLYYSTRNGGFVTILSYDAATHGVTDGGFYRLRRYPGILTVKVEMVTRNATGRAVGFDLSLDGGRSWIGSTVGCALDTEIDVSAYPSSSPVLRVILGSSDSTSPEVLDLRMMVWQVPDLEANLPYIIDLAHAIWIGRLADRAAQGEGSLELQTALMARETEIRQRVAGVIGKGVRVSENSVPAVATGPTNRYASKYFGGS